MVVTKEEINKKRKIDRKLALEKLLQVCIVCGTTQNLEVHHKNLNSPAGELSNLLMLCSDCHHRYHELRQLRKIAKSRLELYYGREVTPTGRIYFQKLDILKNEDSPINMVQALEPHIQSYILLKSLIFDWTLPKADSIDKINRCFEIIDELKNELLRQKDWKKAVRSMNKAKEQLESILKV